MIYLLRNLKFYIFCTKIMLNTFIHIAETDLKVWIIEVQKKHSASWKFLIYRRVLLYNVGDLQKKKHSTSTYVCR